jgi:hypothetical protein
VPSPFKLHDWQVGQLPALQQTPSVHAPLTHWLPLAQPAPIPFFATQLPPAQ